MRLTGNNRGERLRLTFEMFFESEYEKTKFCCISLRYMKIARGVRLRLTFEIEHWSNLQQKSLAQYPLTAD